MLLLLVLLKILGVVGIVIWVLLVELLLLLLLLERRRRDTVLSAGKARTVGAICSVGIVHCMREIDPRRRGPVCV